ncbi:hypothetical protein AVEN_136970-1 [Araneus ventricosus]|uniref:Uncharacterized protein n=1 Tax=Araneus ventricosus TaxID=182803 RepID=A0A4Y2BGW9_ARAVE|nr:hypothetical protein AVEN_136970-1 [Araneus ventricosus]
MRWKTFTLPLHLPRSWGRLISGRTLGGAAGSKKPLCPNLIELPAGLITPDFDQWSAVDRKRPQANTLGCHRDLFKSQDLATPGLPCARLLKGIYCYLWGTHLLSAAPGAFLTTSIL